MNKKIFIILTFVMIIMLTACQNKNKISYNPEERIKIDLIGYDVGVEENQKIRKIDIIEIYDTDEKENSISGRFECMAQPHSTRYITDFIAYYELKENELVLKDIKFDDFNLIIKGDLQTDKND